MKSIVVHLDASARSAERLTWAQRWAQAHEAELTALYAVLPSFQAMPLAATAEMASVYELLEDLDREQRSRALALFKQHTAGAAVRWAEVGSEILEPTLFEHMLLADLLVLGQTDPEDRSAGALPPGFVATVLTNTGKPALVVPFAGSFASIGQTVLMAWKPTREAARAATAALPWLRRAQHIHVACGAATAASPRVGSGALERWLRLQGVSAPLSVHQMQDTAVGEALLSLAADVDADLLVMGCYGHSRAREWVLGGATRTVLDSMTLPVLMAH